MDLKKCADEEDKIKEDAVIVVTLPSSSSDVPRINLTSAECGTEVQNIANFIKANVFQDNAVTSFESSNQHREAPSDGAIIKTVSAEQSTANKAQTLNNVILLDSDIDAGSLISGSHLNTIKENNNPTTPSSSIFQSILTNESSVEQSESMVVDEEASGNLVIIKDKHEYVGQDLENPICSDISIVSSTAGPSLVIDGTKTSQAISKNMDLNLANLPVIIEGVTSSPIQDSNDQLCIKNITEQFTQIPAFFKDHAIPSTSKYVPDIFTNSENTEQSNLEDPIERMVVEQNSCDLKDGSDIMKIPNERSKAKKVEIFAEDTGPQFYNTSSNYVTPPVITENLSEAFSTLPIFGRPKVDMSLEEFEKKKIKEFVGLDDPKFEMLYEYCSTEHLKTGKELVMDSGVPAFACFPLDKNLIIEDGPELNIHKKLKLRLEKDDKNIYMKKMKYRGIRMLPNKEDNTPLVTIGEPLQPGKDLLFRVRIYRPFTYNPNKFGPRVRQLVFSSDLVLLGRHKLSVLRDKIMCCNDEDMRMDISHCPDNFPTTTAKEMFPSGFLFINNVFYVDSRVGCSDHSAPLRQWAAKQGKGDFPVRDLCDLRLDQIQVKLGHPDVYVHQGNCEHLFVFSDIRLLHARDPLKMPSYPRQTAIAQNQATYCTTCADFAAKWVVAGSEAVPFDPAFFCDKCFKSYMYKDGKKIGNFKAYMYKRNEMK